MEGRIAGRYQVRGALGSGESATVYLAQDLVEDRAVALKSASGPEATRCEALRREFELLTRLRHPNLPEVYDFGWEGGSCFFTMEVVAGLPLVEGLGGLDTAGMARLLQQACLGLAYQHERGLVHGDLKPSNLLVRVDADGRVHLKIIDLGLSDRAGAGERGVFRGTPRYAAASLLAGRPPTVHSDLHALGASFLDAVGRWGDEGEVGELRPVAPELLTVLERLVDRDQDARYQSARDALRDLEPLAGSASAVLGSEAAELRGAFVGRSDERQCLEELCQRVGAGEAQAGVLVVCGPAGIGKTALLDEARRAAEMERVLVCRVRPGGSRAPFAGWSATLRHLELVLEGAEPQLADDLRALARAVAPPSAESEPLPTGDEAFRERLALALERAATTRPLVLQIDPLGVGDEDTLALLALLSRRRGPAVVVACRTDDDGAEACIERLRREAGAQRLDLPPLTAEETCELVAGLLDPLAPPPGVPARIAALTDGSPLFAESAARAVLEEHLRGAAVGLEEAVRSGLPRTLTEALERRLDELSERERRIVRALAILTREAPLEVLEELIEPEPSSAAPPLRDALRRLVRLAWVRRDDDPSGVVFSLRSEVLRARLLAELEPPQLRALHRRALDAWVALADDPADLAHVLVEHALAADASDLALCYGCAVAERWIERRAGGLALELMARLEALEASSQSEVRRRLDELAGDAHFQGGSIGEARARFERSLSLFPDEAREDRARLLRKLAAAAGAAGELESAAQTLRSASAAVRDPDETSHIHQLAAQIAFRRGLTEEARGHLEAGLAALPDPEVGRRAAALWNDRGVLAFEAAEYEQSAGFHRKALAIREREGDLEGRSRSLTNLGAVAQVAGRSVEAQEFYERALEIKRELGNRRGAALTLSNIASLDHGGGRFGRAIQRFEECLRIREELGDVVGQVRGHRNLAAVWLAKGELVRALEEADAAVRIARATEERDNVLAGSLTVRAEVELELGRREAGLRFADEALAIALQTEHHSEEGAARRLRGRLLAAAPEGVEPGREELARAVELLRRLEEPRNLCAALLDAAELELDAGRGDGADPLLAQAVEQTQSLQAPLLTARADLARGRRALARGAVETASEALHEARRVGEELGVPEILWRVQAALADFHASGGRRRRALGWARECVGTLRTVLSRLKDPELESAYLAHPGRAAEVLRLERWLTAGRGHAPPHPDR